MLRSLVFTISSLLLVLHCASTYGQQATPAKVETTTADSRPAARLYPKSDTAYANEPVVIEKAWTVYRYAADGTGVKEISVLIRVQSEAAVRQFGILPILYTANNEQVEISFVRVRKPNGTVINTPPADAQEMPAEVTRQAPMYSDIREKQIPIRSLSAGDELEYEIKVRTTKPQVVGQFWSDENFATGVVALDEMVEAHVPRQQELQVRSPNYKPEITVTADERIYRWKAAQLEATVPASGEDGKDKKAKPKAGALIELPDVSWTTFRNWEAVGDWYRTLARERAVVTPEIEAKAKELTRGPTQMTKSCGGFTPMSPHRFAISPLISVSGDTNPILPGKCLAINTGTAKTNTRYWKRC